MVVVAIVVISPERRSVTEIDDYVFEVLMRDLVGHDKQPSAYLVYLFLLHETLGKGRAKVQISLQELALETGLSKSSVQLAVRALRGRQLVRVHKDNPTAVPWYSVERRWRRGKS
jgi:hypothetical protein